MISVSMFEAKTNLSKYVSSVETKEEPFVIIVRNGKPVAKIVPYDAPVNKRIGLGKDKLSPMPSLDDFNAINTVELFEGEGIL